METYKARIHLELDEDDPYNGSFGTTVELPIWFPCTPGATIEFLVENNDDISSVFKAVITKAVVSLSGRNLPIEDIRGKEPVITCRFCNPPKKMLIEALYKACEPQRRAISEGQSHWYRELGFNDEKWQKLLSKSK